jgi:hypothetical protein
MNRLWAAFTLALLCTFALLGVVGLSMSRQEDELVALRARVDEQGRKLDTLLQLSGTPDRSSVPREDGAGARGAPPGERASDVPGLSPPSPAGTAAAPQVAQFLKKAGIEPETWHAVQQVNEAWRTETWRLAAELARATPEEATTRLDDLERRRATEVARVLAPAQREAYERFRAGAGLYGQVVCGSDRVTRLLPMY